MNNNILNISNKTKDYYVFLTLKKVFTYTSLVDAETVYDKLPYSFLAYKLENGNYFLISRTFEMPIICKSFNEVLSTIKEHGAF